MQGEPSACPGLRLPRGVRREGSSQDAGELRFGVAAVVLLAARANEGGLLGKGEQDSLVLCNKIEVRRRRGLAGILVSGETGKFLAH